MLLSAVHPAEAAPPQRVLILHSFGRDFAPFDVVASELRAELARRSPQPVEVLEASLEMARFDGVEKDGPLLDFLTAIFKERAPDLLVPIGAPAALFFHRHRRGFFPQTPMLVVAADKRRIQAMEADPAFVAVGVELELRLLLNNILDVLPATRHVHVLMGTAPLERFWEEELRREWPPLAEQVQFHWLSGQSIEQMRDTVRRLPPGSAVFYGILSRDGGGVTYAFEAGLAAIHEVSSAPVFGSTEQQVGLGVVGGRLLPMREVGARSAQAAVQLLAGAPATEVRGVLLPLSGPLYDWRELQRWGIPESRLPPGSTVRFRQPGLWQTHRTAVLATAGLLAVQSGLIVLLLAARRRARESEASLRLATEAAGVGLWHRRSDARDALDASPEWRALFGLPENGPIKTADVLSRIHPDDRATVRHSIEQAVQEGRNFDLEHRIVKPDGTQRWIASRGRAGRGRNGARTRGVSMDITERKRAEAEAALQRDELAHLSRVSSLGVLSGALAHELNQPLGIILSNAQAAQHLLSADRPDLAELREILSDIVSEDRRAGDVIKRLRALLRRGERALQPLDVNEVLKEVLRLARGDLTGRGVEVRCTLAEPPPAVMADRVQLQQVLLNLILNACDAMAADAPDQRVLILATSREEDEIRLTVRDRGIGLPADVEAMFKPFHTTKAHGLGMGLTICRTLIDAHGGRLWAEANSDRGAAFHVALPGLKEGA